MTHFKNVNFNSGFIGGNQTVNVTGGVQITKEQWRELSKFAARNGEGDEYDQVRDVERLVDEGNPEEAGKIWRGIKWFFETPIAWSANVAQIADFVHDTLKKVGAC